jgi:hypothetical protein
MNHDLPILGGTGVVGRSLCDRLIARCGSRRVLRMRRHLPRTLDNPVLATHRRHPPATMIERVFAAIVLAVCAVLMARLLIGERRRWRFDAAMRRAWHTLRGRADALRQWRATRRDAASAEAATKAANDAIARARGRGDWDGNVYRPKSFRKPPRDKMH